jgi:hypothetical protein
MKGNTDMASNELLGRWAKESVAMLMIGDALVTMVDPQRHCRLWMKGPEKWRQFLGLFEQRPGLTRGLALAELGLGMWLAEKQTPIAAPEDSSEASMTAVASA